MICWRLKARSCASARGARGRRRMTCVDVRVRAGSGREAPLDELGVAHDGRQQIVEIVGHAAGQRPTASIFCACRNCPSSRLCSVTSTNDP